MRALLYARYSTTLQSSLSIDDQLRVCADLCAREGWTVAGQHCDAAISGAVRDRPGLNALLEAVAAGSADVVVAESIDRLSRDQEDIAAIFKRVRYAGALIWTLSEGEVGELHIGLRGTMAAMVRKDTADKVKRGLTGRALAGMNPGGMAYGYRKVPKLDDRGEPVRGLRVVDDEQATVVRRIFDDYAAGVPARSIAARLNAEGVPGPSGGLWRASSINGDPKRKNGILQNELYRGRMIYNRTRRVTHPVSRKREIRLNPESEWIRLEAPDLRIVSDAQWTTAERIRARFGGRRAEYARRPKRLLSGKAECGVCGNGWRIVSGERWGCSAHHDGRGCSNGRTIVTAAFERRVLRGLSERLLDPELVRIYVEEWRAAWKELSAQGRGDRRRLERRSAELERKVARLVAAIADGLGEFEDVRRALVDARDERARVGAQLQELAAEKVVALHPRLADDYRRRIADLTVALEGDDQLAARNALRSLIGRIVVTPAAGRGVDIEVHGILASAIELAGGKLPKGTPAIEPDVLQRWCPWDDSAVPVQSFLRAAC